MDLLNSHNHRNKTKEEFPEFCLQHIKKRRGTAVFFSPGCRKSLSCSCRLLQFLFQVKWKKVEQIKAYSALNFNFILFIYTFVCLILFYHHYEDCMEQASYEEGMQEYCLSISTITCEPFHQLGQCRFVFTQTHTRVGNLAVKICAPQCLSEPVNKHQSQTAAGTSGKYFTLMYVNHNHR